MGNEHSQNKPDCVKYHVVKNQPTGAQIHIEDGDEDEVVVFERSALCSQGSHAGNGIAPTQCTIGTGDDDAILAETDQSKSPNVPVAGNVHHTWSCADVCSIS